MGANHHSEHNSLLALLNPRIRYTGGDTILLFKSRKKRIEQTYSKIKKLEECHYEWGGCPDGEDMGDIWVTPTDKEYTSKINELVDEVNELKRKIDEDKTKSMGQEE